MLRRTHFELGTPTVLCKISRLTAVIAVVALLPWTAWGVYTPNPGPYQVLTIENCVLHDEARNKNIPIRIYYPDSDGIFPVIIFSHGALASKNAYSALGRYWASYGYVSIHPSHADSIVDSGYRGTFREALSDPQAWPNRPKDISFIIDSLPYIEKQNPQLAGKLDTRHIGVGGHSFGSYTAALVGGTRILPPGEKKPKSFVDKRASAIVLLSPEGEGIMGLTEHSWDKLHLPVLLMYGSRDFGPFGEPAVWRREAFEKEPEGNKYEVELEGGTHMGFAGSGSRGGHSGEVLQYAKVETLAFWDAYLKDDPEAKEFLSQHRLQQFTGDNARFESK